MAEPELLLLLMLLPLKNIPLIEQDVRRKLDWWGYSLQESTKTNLSINENLGLYLGRSVKFVYLISH